MCLLADSYITLGVHVQQWLCSCRVCVCVSVKSHLTSGASVRPENAAMYSAGNEGKNIVVISMKPMHFRDQVLPPLEGHTYGWPFPAKNMHVHCTYASSKVQ